MAHRIYVSGDGATAAELTEGFEDVPGVEVVPRASGEGLAFDPVTVTLLVAGLGTVNALIAALASVWAARIAHPPAAPPDPAASVPVRPVLHLHTDLDSIRVTLAANGDVLVTSGPLPESLEDITEVRMSAEPT